MRVYIAGPYTAATIEERNANIDRAREVMADLMRMGHTPFCPHTMTAGMEETHPEFSHGDYMRLDIDWLRLCDAVVLLDGWDMSEGALIEYEKAQALSIPIVLVDSFSGMKAELEKKFAEVRS